MISIVRQLNTISTRLNELIEDMERVMDYIDNDELYNEISNNVVSQLNTTSTYLEIVIDDINELMYEEAPHDGDLEDEWD